MTVAASADARPVWRTYPTPLPPPVHLARVRPVWIGPVWRQWDSPRVVSADFAPAEAAQPRARAADTAVVTWTPDPPAAPAPAVPVVAAAKPAPGPAPIVVAAKAPEPPPAAPVVAAAKPAPVPPPAKIVVAQNAPDSAPPAAPPVAAPMTLEPASPRTPWLDYISAFVMAIVLGGVIYFFTRDRKRTA